MSGNKAMLTRAAIWTVASVLFLDVAVGKVRNVRAVGLVVSPWRYLQVVFWVGMLGFWGWTGWRAWRAGRVAR